MVRRGAEMAVILSKSLRMHASHRFLSRFSGSRTAGKDASKDDLNKLACALPARLRHSGGLTMTDFFGLRNISYNVVT